LLILVVLSNTLPAMSLNMGLWILDLLLLFILFVMAPVIAVLIARAAWKGKPNNFNRQKYLIACVGSAIIACVLMVNAHWLQADITTGKFLVELICFILGAVIFGVAGGCLVSSFVYGRGRETLQDALQKRSRVVV
jgi:hypothetical protein